MRLADGVMTKTGDRQAIAGDTNGVVPRMPHIPCPGGVPNNLQMCRDSQARSHGKVGGKKREAAGPTRILRGCSRTGPTKPVAQENRACGTPPLVDSWPAACVLARVAPWSFDPHRLGGHYWPCSTAQPPARPQRSESLTVSSLPAIRGRWVAGAVAGKCIHAECDGDTSAAAGQPKQMLPAPLVSAERGQRRSCSRDSGIPDCRRQLMEAQIA
ncbi:uncharacterized protein EI97DRAFT_118965 [Westerdykella ornata]|uniref:Uncharacterized protein n=1 Tax=Westerdykella ornata TaxID=318751 RepID=A0A6A6JUL8_WESOR|nr:uncharacterized protein EI97DRAFT_118965 [Westerdykella ornata]KAF2280321.1 hypothetical protein EI97DRAFT_118965 [Westerdykella ornata]